MFCINVFSWNFSSIGLMLILPVTALLKTVLKNKYVQAVLRGLKPCMIGIVLAAGVFRIFRNCFEMPSGADVYGI